jgi:hypothetical protein
MNYDFEEKIFRNPLDECPEHLKIDTLFAINIDSYKWQEIYRNGIEALNEGVLRDE